MQPCCIGDGGRPPGLGLQGQGPNHRELLRPKLATIECTLADDLRPVVKALRRSARITDAELVQEFYEMAAHRRKGAAGVIDLRISVALVACSA